MLHPEEEGESRARSAFHHTHVRARRSCAAWGLLPSVQGPYQLYPDVTIGATNNFGAVTVSDTTRLGNEVFGAMKSVGAGACSGAAGGRRASRARGHAHVVLRRGDGVGYGEVRDKPTDRSTPRSAWKYMYICTAMSFQAKVLRQSWIMDCLWCTCTLAWAGPD